MDDVAGSPMLSDGEIVRLTGELAREMEQVEILLDNETVALGLDHVGSPSTRLHKIITHYHARMSDLRAQHQREMDDAQAKIEGAIESIFRARRT